MHCKWNFISIGTEQYRFMNENDPMSPTSESTPKKLSLSSPGPITSPSQEQRELMEKKRLEAEARRLARRFGAEEIGISWVKALLAEFKKPYVQEVSEVWKARQISWDGIGSMSLDFPLS